MSEPIAYGIDFGTTNSAIAVAFDDGTTQVVGTPDELTPSLIYLNRNLNRLIGEQAIRTFVTAANARTLCGSCDLVDFYAGQAHSECRNRLSGGGCFDARLIAQIKGDLANEDFIGTHSWAQDFTIEDLVGIVLTQLKKAADRQLGTSVNRVTIGHPVLFAGAEGPQARQRQELALSRLTLAAQRAGFTEHVGLMEESKAAVSTDGVDGGVLLCLDFGGGTFDVAVVDVQGTRADVLSLNGVAIGGEEFDAKMFDEFVAPALDLDVEFTKKDGQTRRLPNEIRVKLRSLGGVNELMSENLAAGVTSHLGGLEHSDVLNRIHALITGGAAWPTFQAIKKAKHELSQAPATDIDVRSAALTLRIPVTREAFEAAIASDLTTVQFCFEDALEDAGVTPDEVAFVAVTGGSSQIPAFRAMVEACFPQAEMVEMDPFTSVVRGLARHAYEEWAS